MWKNLLDFSAKRDWKAAALFYAVYAIVGFIICMMATSAGAALNGIETEKALKEFAPNIFMPASGIYALILSLAILMSKNLYKDFVAILCVIVAAFASTSVGLFIGIIPAAVITTFAKKED